MRAVAASDRIVEWFRNSSSNRRAVLLPLGLLMLSLAVFGWGLQYKLSLYQGKSSIAHLTPEAKLLSQKERPATAQARDIRFPVLPAYPFLAAFVLVAVTLFLRQAAARSSRTESIERSRPSRPPCLQAVFFRPPPVLT
jgi:hypothetical protein